ncbi:MAG: DUF3277 family protein [Ekhidna sp.]|nr:DUF3277 family protein [Ekhidna sp.]
MKQYTFNKVDLIIDGVTISGFADSNNIITAARAVNAHNDVIDAKGNMNVATSANKSGLISFNLLHTSDSNQVLQARAILDQSLGLADNNAVFIPWHAIVQDKMGGTLVAATTGYIPKVPNLSRGNSFTVHNWTVRFEQIEWPVPGTYTDIL